MVLVSVSTVSLAFNGLNVPQSVVFTADNHVLDIGSAIKGTTSLSVNFPQVADVPAKTKNKKAAKVISKKITAINLDGKILAIKGFVEEDTINAEAQVSIDELAALNQLLATTTPPVVDTSENTSLVGNIVATEIVVNIPPVDEPVSLEEDGDISEYTVVEGDTIESVAKQFNISVDTILWANDLKRTSTIKIGQKLAILPISGVSYKIKSGDTVSEIAERFNISQRELVEFNDLQDGRLVIGDTIIIPGGTIKSTTTGSNNGSVKNVPKSSAKDAGTGFFSRPVNGGIKTQGIHGHNGIDIAGPIGTPILAARGGTVILVRGGSTWNGGYGNYVVVSHENGIQTLYAHMNSITVSQGQHVTTGQQVGTLGNTGQSTGPHLHFEVRGARNPF